MMLDVIQKYGHKRIYYKYNKVSNPVTQLKTSTHGFAIDLQCGGGMLVFVSEKEEIHL